MKMRETLTIPITERNQFDGIHPPLRAGEVVHVVRCERDEELHPRRIYWVYHVHEDALVEMLFARVVVHQGRIVFTLHRGTIISPDDAVVAGILSSSDHQNSLNR
jgi:hypothetical protein